MSIDTQVVAVPDAAPSDDSARELTCLRCQHQWRRKVDSHLPRQCPQCRSPRWNKPRVRKTPPALGVMNEP